MLPDEVIAAMARVAHQVSRELRCSKPGGLSITPTADRIAARFQSGCADAARCKAARCKAECRLVEIVGPAPNVGSIVNVAYRLLAVSSLLLWTPLLPPRLFAAEEKNDGVLNGPLMTGGHKASHQGNAETLAMTIRDLMASHGERYPQGASYLKRLEAIADPKSAEFEELKREALLANPLLDFDKLLLVKSPHGNRFSANWQNRASMNGGLGRARTEKDLKDFGSRLCQRDRNIAPLHREFETIRRDLAKHESKLKASPDYRQAADKQAKLAVLEADVEWARLAAMMTAAERKVRAALERHPAYQKLAALVKSGAVVPDFEDELVVMSLRKGCSIQSAYRPEPGAFIGDVDLHWSGGRVLFSSHRDVAELIKGPGSGKGWAVFELALDPASGVARGQARPVSPDLGSDVDCFDGVYLPDDRIIFASTASYQGVPCVGGKDYVANLYSIEKDGSGIRRLTFDQESNWHPVVMEDGRVLYTRWEYTDSAHYFSRVLMSMNPDGTDQKSYYGSNSYWPNSLFHARKIPGKPSLFVATVTGHHDAAKNGPLVLFDVLKGRREADGAVQILTARNKEVKPIVHDKLTRNYSPIFCHPYPLSEKYFLAGNSHGEIFLLDVFDNVLKLNDVGRDGRLFEPLPLRKTTRARHIPDRIRPGAKDATVLINDVYYGPGLKGVPRGTVKSMRVYRYEFSPRHSGSHYAMGMESGWDAKQILGTVPVEEDGSASFKVPANTPFAVQPLDEQGRALQGMRSWTVAMPGEYLSCIGCHESPNSSPNHGQQQAMLRVPSELESFHGPTRGFSFKREVQPVLDRHCISCHNGTKELDAGGRDRAGRYTVADRIIGTGSNTGRKFAECGIPDFTKGDRNSFNELHPFVRRNGPEGDYHLLTPLEFHTNTSELFQMLEKGHHGVTLERADWDRLHAWADLNAPLHGTWAEGHSRSNGVFERRLELRKLISGTDYNPNEIPKTTTGPVPPVKPKPVPAPTTFAQASQVRGAHGGVGELDLGNGVAMKFTTVPAGEFSMGSNTETPLERPISRVSISKPFEMGVTEVTLRQYRQFDPEYLNGVYDMHYKDQVKRGYYMNDMDFPVIRVSWEKAMAFCEWLSEKTGKSVTLPTEAEWEWACRAGTTTPLSFGDLNADFSKHANLADVTVKQMAVKGVNPMPIKNPQPAEDYELKDPRSDDGALHLAKVGSYAPNPWGLHDMHGNAAEWTLSDYEAYPYRADDGRNGGGPGDKVVRGGSWHDRMHRSSSSYRLGFPAWQRVYHTGFRVVIK